MHRLKFSFHFHFCCFDFLVALLFGSRAG
jgi:hypothetical protein